MLCRVGHLSHTMHVLKKCHIVVSQATWVSHIVPLNLPNHTPIYVKTTTSSVTSCLWGPFGHKGNRNIAMFLEGKKNKERNLPFFCCDMIPPALGLICVGYQIITGQNIFKQGHGLLNIFSYLVHNYKKTLAAAIIHLIIMS